MVVTKEVFVRRPIDPVDEKKKEATGNPFFLHRSVTDPITAVLPVPAGPVTHFMLVGLTASPCSIQLYKSSCTATLVSGSHLGASQRSAESCKASGAMNASSSTYHRKGQPNVGEQYDKIDGLTFQYVCRGVSIENLEGVDAKVASVVKVSCHGSVEVEEGRRPRAWLC